jgi:transcriptional regulator with PAS, ATPase and Fis domain
VLETGTFMRVGSTQARRPTRSIAATNRNPLQAVASGKLLKT